MAISFISKTAYLKFEQCHKAFFLYKNHYYLKDKLSTDKKLTFQRGHQVGELAQQLFPGGINIVAEDSNKEAAVANTAKCILNKVPVIYEATFLHDGVLVMLDILVLTDDGYSAYEVKSSIKVSETYIKDACLQFYVIKNCLPNLKDFFLVTLNESYVLEEKLDLKKLFKKRSVLKDAQKNESYFKSQLAIANDVLDKGMIPNIEVGKHCYVPYQCDFHESCWKDKITPNSIFSLGKVSKDELFNWFNQGIRSISEIHNIKELSVNLQIQILCSKGKTTHIDKLKIAEVLNKIKKPYAAFDMEIWGQAVPVINGTKPFQKVPFLFTLYREGVGTYSYFDYETDERRGFALALIEETEKYNTLLVYDKSLESLIIKELIQLFPDQKSSLSKVSEKLLDISEIIHKSYYFHYLFNGNYSLKAVSKVVLEDNVFEDEHIFSGLEAMNAFVNFRAEENAIQKQAIKDDLINYCQADTKATFLIAEKFKELIKAE